MTRSDSLWVWLGLLLSPGLLSAQFDLDLPSSKPKGRSFESLGSVKLEVVPAQARPGELVDVRLTLTSQPDAWTYPTQPRNSQQTSRNILRLPQKSDLIFLGEWKDPPDRKKKPDSNDEYYVGSVTWSIPAIVSPEATPGSKTLALTGSMLLFCYKDAEGKEGCTQSDRGKPPSTTFEVLPGPAQPIPAEYQAIVAKALAPSGSTSEPPISPSPGINPQPAGSPGSSPGTEGFSSSSGSVLKKAPIPLAEYQAQLDAIRQQMTVPPPPERTGLAVFLATAAFWGVISLVTPCVFPMIPITVSIFLKQSHDSTAQTLKLALVYCLTIIAVLGVSAFALLKLFVQLSIHPLMNLFLGLLFIVFALSLLGMYDLTLPQGLLRFTQKRQQGGGIIGTIFGALAFTIIGFTCVAPFLGGFAGLAASGSYNTAELILGALTFATAFASPFFLLALFPRLLKALPRSGSWLDSVKAVMGFLELAAAFKFFRTAEIGWSTVPEYFTYDVVLGAWVAISAACGLYLLNVFRLPHDEEAPNIGVPRLLFALAFLGLAVYLWPATFKTADGKPQRPSGVVYAWIDAFLLPDTTRAAGSELPYSADLKAMLEDARAETARTGQPAYVFLDFTGVTCTNCSYNENTVFTLPLIQDLLKQYRRVKLYTDWVPEEYYTIPPSRYDREEEAYANFKFKEQAFHDDVLPYYAILKPRLTGGIEVVDTWNKGKINDPAAFAAFLRQPWAEKSR